MLFIKLLSRKKSLLFLFLVSILSTVNAQINDGIYTGILSNQGIDLQIDIVIDQENNQALLSIPMQGLEDIISTSIFIQGDSISIDYSMFRARYDGKISKEGIINGSWIQGKEFPLSLKKTDKKTVFLRPQTPVAPFPYEVDTIIVHNEKANVSLSGTLTTPKGEGPFPAVILVSGSGRQNRDSDILGHKPFHVIADFLTRNGIIVLRYDDRGVGESTGNFTKATTEDLATDAEAVWTYLNNLENVSHTGIIGHSEGGMIAPLLASKNKNIDFIITLAGPGVSISELMTSQNIAILKTNGASEQGLAITEKRLPEIYSIVNQPKEPKELFDTLIAAVHSYYDELPIEDQQLLAPNKASYYMQLAGSFFSDWFRYFLSYDPTDSWLNVNCPVLAINGDKDIQVDGKNNLSAIETNLKNGKNPEQKIVLINGLNHLMQPCDKCNLSEYNTIETSIDKKVLILMKDFILDNQNSK